MNSSTPTVQPMWAASSDTQQLWSIVALLAVLGIGLTMLAVAVFKATRPDRELLAPLEVMGRRKWRRSDPVFQRRELDAVRAPDAEPLTPAPAWPEPLPDFDRGPAAPGFDDLHGEDGDHEMAAADGTDALDAGLDGALTELPGGEVFDSDPTPPSRELPVIVVDEAPREVPLAQLGVDWSAPAPEDVTVQADAPVLHGDDGHDGDAADGAAPDRDDDLADTSAEHGPETEGAEPDDAGRRDDSDANGEDDSDVNGDDESTKPVG